MKLIEVGHISCGWEYAMVRGGGVRYKGLGRLKIDYVLCNI